MDAIEYVQVKLEKVPSLRKETHTDIGILVLNMLEGMLTHDLAELRKGVNIE